MVSFSSFFQSLFLSKTHKKWCLFPHFFRACFYQKRIKNGKKIPEKIALFRALQRLTLKLFNCYCQSLFEVIVSKGKRLFDKKI